MAMKKVFYSNGKLLITGEYVVLDGAKAFALPTKFGQNLVVESIATPGIFWTSYDQDGTIWFQDSISFDEIKNPHPQEIESVKNTLITILHQSYLLNPNFIDTATGYSISTHLTFPKSWGLGTSSTLINNIAQWLEVDAYCLLKLSFGGSGYDIACAQNNFPLSYQLVDGNPIIERCTFHHDFTSNIYFVYLNKKQNSRTAIASYYKKRGNLSRVIKEISQITNTLISGVNWNTFKSQLSKHEILLSQILEMETLQESHFPDFEGTIKSLGAWGGDFVMVLSEKDPTDYFLAKGYAILLPYSEMIL
jgi:mevalonate kinase